MPRAIASHILVASEDQAIDLKARVEAGETFADLASEHSMCPSGKSGGSLGEFGQGDMVPEFDAVIFSELPIGEVSDPVQTQFGYHLIKVDHRLG